VKRTAVLVAAAVLFLPTGGISAQDGGSDPPNGPNVVVIMTDDQRFDDMATLPRVNRLIGEAGVTFTRAYVSYPVCCPARATFFTGQYAQNHHVLCLYPSCGGGYGHLNQSNYLPVWLEDAGYTTAHIGKFLNGYGTEPETPLDPNGWTEWYGLVDHSTYRMWGYKIREKGPGDDEGTTKTYGKVRGGRPALYQTDVLTGKAVDFIDRRGPDPRPFFLSVAYLAPHHESGHTQAITGQLVRAAPRHRGFYAGRPLPKPPGYNEDDMSDKPSFVARFNRRVNAKREAAITKRFHERWESLLAVDEGVEKIVDALRKANELDNTYVIFTSDHGFMQGEHRIPQGKMVPYDASTHVPLLIRGPGVSRGRRTKALVGDVDLAPTILDATPARAPGPRDGRSVLPFARNPRLRSLRPFLHTTAGRSAKGRTNTREGGARGVQPRVPAWSAVRTTRWLYIEYRGGYRELYDRRRDPWEMNSIVDEPTVAVRQRVRTLRRILGDLRTCRGPACSEIAAASVR
jgi:N-acetylglucosamine-6-sulfatase